ncbi:hypothetical protein BU16DRAFT_554174 [Lophium mytilinum]|uniref:Uncharacterized protein n=1 Tax=Lophium mytilinum TaxID=390894 RepID=A0A6A6REE3_9PEZI|nr:hypothetical protein BU16DRAFT_554174 [Lophium mytilinum]
MNYTRSAEAQELREGFVGVDLFRLQCLIISAVILAYLLNAGASKSSSQSFCGSFEKCRASLWFPWSLERVRSAMPRAIRRSCAAAKVVLRALEMCRAASWLPWPIQGDVHRDVKMVLPTSHLAVLPSLILRLRAAATDSSDSAPVNLHSDA